MKNKNIILSMLAVLIIVLSGIGIGYCIFKENNNSLNENKENQNNELIKLLDKYVQSIKGACVGDDVYKKLFGGDFLKISEVSSDIQLNIISNYFEDNYSVKNIEYYEYIDAGEFYLDFKNILCDAEEHADLDGLECYSQANESLYRFSDLEELFNKVYGPNSKYYSNIVLTQGFPTMNKLKDSDEYFNIVYRGGCGPTSFLDLNYSHYEETKNKIEIYYYFGYGLYEGKYYTGTMNDLILLEENIPYSNLENMSNKYKDKLTQFKMTFFLDTNNNYYFDSIQKVD